MKKISLIVIAEEEEIEINKQQNLLLDSVFLINNIRLFLYKNLVSSKEFALLFCGVGKSNSAFSLTNSIWALKEKGYLINNIINIGPVGSIQDESIGNEFLIEKAYFYDVDLTYIPGYKLGQLPNNEYDFITSVSLNKKISMLYPKKIQLKNICTADKFFFKQDIKKINNLFTNISLVDMETASLVQIANKLNIEISIIKIVSDLLNHDENYYISKKNIWKSKVNSVFKFLTEEFIKN